jgi:hypothetical protein
MLLDTAVALLVIAIFAACARFELLEREVNPTMSKEAKAALVSFIRTASSLFISVN